jgi:hypothetical protein
MNQVEDHLLDERLEEAYDRMSMAVYEIDTVHQAIVAQQNAIIETQKGQLEYVRAALDEANTNLRLSEVHAHLLKDKYTALLQIQKEELAKLTIDKRNAEAERERAIDLAQSMLAFKQHALDMTNQVSAMIERDIEAAVDLLSRVRVV